MKEQTMRQRVLAHIIAHPYSVRAEIQEAVGGHSSTIGSVITELSQRKLIHYPSYRMRDTGVLVREYVAGPGENARAPYPSKVARIQATVRPEPPIMETVRKATPAFGPFSVVAAQLTGGY